MKREMTMADFEAFESIPEYREWCQRMEALEEALDAAYDRKDAGEADHLHSLLDAGAKMMSARIDAGFQGALTDDQAAFLRGVKLPAAPVVVRFFSQNPVTGGYDRAPTADYFDGPYHREIDRQGRLVAFTYGAIMIGLAGWSESEIENHGIVVRYAATSASEEVFRGLELPDEIAEFAAEYTPAEMLAFLEDGEALAAAGVTDQAAVEEAHDFFRRYAATEGGK